MSSFNSCGSVVSPQDVQQDSQTTLERKTLRRAFYSREAKNQMDDEDEGDASTAKKDSSALFLFREGFTFLST